MDFIWTDPSVQAALIQAVGGTLASTIASVGAVVVGKRFLDQKRLQQELETCKSDIAFLLAVEKEHTKEDGQKLIVRNSVRDRGLGWSGRFTPGRVKG